MTASRASHTGVTLIGDLVGSRRADDRRAVHDALVRVLDNVNRAVAAEAPLAVTVGDEFQARYAGLGGALEASFRVRLALLPQIDTRFGLGCGPVSVLDPVRGIEDGPGWWAAREAIERVEAESRGALRALRTGYTATARDEAPDDATPDPLARAVAGALHFRDHVLGTVTPRSLRLLGGLLAGANQAELAVAEGISPSAVSQRVRTDALALLLDAEQNLWRLP